MNITTDNYYSREADAEYMSCSQYQGWLECEAKQNAKIEGRWQDKDSKAFLIGNYFHTFFEGPEAHSNFCEEHFDDIYKTKTRTDKKTGIATVSVIGKYADYEQADTMIRVAERDPLIKALIDLEGENEKIMTGEIFGMPWRIRIDKYVAIGRMIIDWKTTKNIWETSYNPILKSRETFIDTYGYMMRAAVYSEIEKQNTGQSSDPQFIIVAISKQEHPDKEVLLLNHRQRYEWELEQIKDNLARIRMVKNGTCRPTRCGYCDYCRATKTLHAIMPYYKLMPEFREGREEEIATVEEPMLDDAQETRELGDMPAVSHTTAMGENTRLDAL